MEDKNRFGDLKINTIVGKGDKHSNPNSLISRQSIKSGIIIASHYSSLRDTILYFDKPIGENQYMQPYIYNRLQKTTSESNTGNNQSLFRTARRHTLRKSWLQVNISNNIQAATPSNDLSNIPPINTDTAGNQFFTNGIIKLAPGITKLVIPAEYLVTQLIAHKKTRSRRTITGSDGFFRSPRLLSDIRPTNNEWLSQKSYIKFSVSGYIQPQGTVGQPGYIHGQYEQGKLSNITLTSHRYTTKTGVVTWTTELLER